MLELFDLIVESSKIGHRKPERRFYEIACEQLGVEPAQCVFLDDLGVNLKPARDMGMTTIKVTASRATRSTTSRRCSGITLRCGDVGTSPEADGVSAGQQSRLTARRRQKADGRRRLVPTRGR